MSSLFKQISQEAAKQRQQLDPSAPEVQPESVAAHQTPETPAPASKLVARKRSQSSSQKAAPQSGTTAPQSGTTNGSVDLKKLETIITQMSQIPVNSNGINVRVSSQEAQDIEEFIYGRLRQEGLKGYDVSIAKLMRYALRYLSRVHEDEFVKALKNALTADEKLSI
jgi:hypothetical protein